MTFFTMELRNILPRRLRLTLLTLLTGIALPLAAQTYTRTTTVTTTTTETLLPDGTIENTVTTDTVISTRELPAPKVARIAHPDPFIGEGFMGHFTWGVDASAAIDLTARDMSNIDFSAHFGYKTSGIRFLGIGAGITSMIDNQSYSYPIYAMVRTTFSAEPRVCFLEARGGIAINKILNDRQTTNPYASLGVGFTLAHTRKFSSHIILRGIFLPLGQRTTFGELPENAAPDEAPPLVTTSGYNLWFANIGIGCAF